MTSFHRSIFGNMAESTGHAVKISNETDKVRHRSMVWKHFGFKITTDERGRSVTSTDKVVCKLCFGEFAFIGTTTNMAVHLSRHHGIENKTPNVDKHGTSTASGQLKIGDFMNTSSSSGLYRRDNPKYKLITNKIGM